MKKLVLGAALALALTAAGCGGGGGGETLSKEEFGSQLNTICADYNAKVKEIGEPSNISELADKGTTLLDEFDAAIAKAEKLKAPDELKATRDEFFSKSKELRDRLRDLVAAAKDNDTAKIEEIGSKVDEVGSETDALGKELGAPACAE